MHQQNEQTADKYNGFIPQIKTRQHKTTDTQKQNTCGMGPFL